MLAHSTHADNLTIQGQLVEAGPCLMDGRGSGPTASRAPAAGMRPDGLDACGISQAAAPGSASRMHMCAPRTPQPGEYDGAPPQLSGRTRDFDDGEVQRTTLRARECWDHPA